MNTDQMTGVLRAIVPAGVAYAVGRGWIPQSSAADVITAALACGAAGWSIFSNRSGKTIS